MVYVVGETQVRRGEKMHDASQILLFVRALAANYAVVLAPKAMLRLGGWEKLSTRHVK
mgnify:CR=1 FL=1